MRIGVDIRTLMDEKYSGISQYTLNLTKELIKLNQELDSPHDFKFFYNSGRDIRHRLPEFIFNQGTVTGTRFPNKFFNYGLQKCLSRPKLDKLLKVEVFLMPHFNFTCLSPGCKKILTVHDLSFLKNPNFFNFRKNVWHRLLNIKKIIQQSDHIVTISKNTKKDIIDLFKEKEAKISVIYNGVSGKFKPISDKEEKLKIIKEKYNLPNRFILFLGTVEPRKNIEGIIKAFDIFTQKYKQNNYYLIIAGREGWKSEPAFKSWKQAKNRHRIKFLGYVADQDKVYLYNLATAFVFPSFYEGFGLPPLEAMACGTPIITSFTSSLPEVVGNAGLTVDPHNILDIFEAIKQITEDANLRQTLSQKGIERAKSFSWENTAKQYLDIINKTYG